MNDLSQFFSLNKLPYNNSEIIPKDWVKKKIELGFVPDEKDNTNPNMYMDEIFAAGGEQPVPPTPVIPEDEIWYTTVDNKKFYTIDGVGYDWAEVIQLLPMMNFTYLGSNVVSNVFDEEIGMYRLKFEQPLTDVGAKTTNSTYIIFSSTNPDEKPDIKVECNVDKVYLPDSITNIYYNCFSNNKNLKEVLIPKNIRNIYDGAFRLCVVLGGNHLTERDFNGFLTIPETVEYIGQNAFHCVSVVNVEYMTPEVYDKEMFGGVPSPFISGTLRYIIVVKKIDKNISPDDYETLYRMFVSTLQPGVEKLALEYFIVTDFIPENDFSSGYTIGHVRTMQSMIELIDKDGDGKMSVEEISAFIAENIDVPDDHDGTIEIIIDRNITEVQEGVTFRDLGYLTMYSQETYDSSRGETQEMFSVIDETPISGNFYYTTCVDIDS